MLAFGLETLEGSDPYCKRYIARYIVQVLGYGFFNGRNRFRCITCLVVMYPLSARYIACSCLMGSVF